MLQSENTKKHKEAVNQLIIYFNILPNKAQARDDLHRLTEDYDSDVRRIATAALGSAFISIPDASKAQAWDDLHRLTEDDDSDVTVMCEGMQPLHLALHLFPFPMLPKLKPGVTFTVSLRTRTVKCEGMQPLHLALLLFPFPMLPKLRHGRT